MKAIVETSNNINYAPQNLLEEVAQNVRMILTTVKGEVPLDRNFGISQTLLDIPANVAKQKLTAEIFQAVKKYEPRAKILQVIFAQDMNVKVIIEVA